MNPTLLLLVVAVVLGFLAVRVHRALVLSQWRWRRVLGIVAGGLMGVAVSLPLAAVLNPLVGLQRGTFHNLAILAMCLAFLGFCIGSLGGLVYAGMILSDAPRMEGESVGEVKPTHERD